MSIIPFVNVESYDPALNPFGYPSGGVSGGREQGGGGFSGIRDMGPGLGYSQSYYQQSFQDTNDVPRYNPALGSNRGASPPAYSPPSNVRGFGDVSHAGEPSSAASGGVYNQPGGDWTRPSPDLWEPFKPPPAYQFGSSYQPLQLPSSDQETDGVSIGFGSRAYPVVDNYPVSPELSPTEWFDALLRGIRNRGLTQPEQQNSPATLLSSIFGNGGT